MSSATSSTQIGSGGGEQAPHVYSPHQGNTLSYTSSTAPSVATPAWDGSVVPRMPNDESSRPTVTSEKIPGHYAPPAYVDDS